MDLQLEELQQLLKLLLESPNVIYLDKAFYRKQKLTSGWNIIQQKLFLLPMTTQKLNKQSRCLNSSNKFIRDKYKKDRFSSHLFLNMYKKIARVNAFYCSITYHKRIRAHSNSYTSKVVMF
jgi:hypothetical protein